MSTEEQAGERWRRRDVLDDADEGHDANFDETISGR